MSSGKGQKRGGGGTLKELSSNPFRENLDKVCALLDKLLKEKQISSKQFTKMMHNRDKTELAHLYFNPKTRKV